MVLFFKQKHARGISISATWLGLLGVGMRTLFIYHTTDGNLTILIPYYFSIICVIITLYYCYMGSSDEE